MCDIWVIISNADVTTWLLKNVWQSHKMCDICQACLFPIPSFFPYWPFYSPFPVPISMILSQLFTLCPFIALAHHAWASLNFFWKPILPDRWSENTFHTILFLSRNRISSCTFLFQAYKYMKKQIKNGSKFTQYQVMNCLDSFHGWFRFRTDYPIEICRSHTLDWLFGKIT